MNINRIRFIIDKLIHKYKLANLSPVERITSLPYAEESIDELYNIFYKIKGGLPIITIKLRKGNYVYRQRRNEIKDFQYISELSYPPAEVIKEYGRANIPGNPMFYGCVFGNNQSEETPFRTSIMEVSKLIKEPNSYGVERTTCSIWEVKDEIILLALPFSDNYKKPAADILETQKQWKALRESGSICEENISLMLHMSEEISKNVDNNLGYIKISCFIDFLLNKNIPTKHYDGILFPSVYSQGEGFNVALKPSVVDNKLKFVNASHCYLIKESEKPNEVNVDFVSYSIGQNKNGLLIFEKEPDFDEKKYIGMNFFN